MSFLSATDFIDKPYMVPNQEESKEFVAFIEFWEEKLLKQLLGIALYNEFIEGLDESGSILQKWIDLRDGAEFSYGGGTYEYDGIITMIRPAIYSEWIKTIYRRPTTTGIVSGTAKEGTTLLDPEYDIATAWNEYVNYSKYFYWFMIENESDYDDWIFIAPRYKNQFNL